MKRSIVFLLAALLCVNVCACGAEQEETVTEEIPVVEEVQEEVTEPVTQEVSAPVQQLVLTHQSYRIENEGLLYINEESEGITVYLGRKKLKDYTVEIENPDILEYTVDGNGNIVLKSLKDGTTEVTICFENAIHHFTVETGKKLTLKYDELTVEPNGSIDVGIDETQEVRVLINDEAIKDFTIFSKVLYPGGKAKVAGQYQKNDDSTILFKAFFEEKCEFTITTHGMTETFVLNIGKKQQGGQSAGTGQAIQAPVIQQINYNYDPANVISYSVLQDAVDAKRKSESTGSLSGISKYLVDDPETKGLVSSEEIKALKSGSGERPNSITYAQAVEDVDLLFRTMKVGYGAYYFFGEEKWEQAETEVMNWLDNKSGVSVNQLKDKLRSSTAFMRDAHSWIATSSDSIPGFRYEYYYCTGHDFSKDENGFYKEKDGVKWYFESCDNDTVSIEPSLKQDGTLVYSPVLFSPWYTASSQITLSNGTEKKTETVVWNLSEPYAEAISKNTDPQFQYIEEGGVAYMSIRHMNDKEYPEIFQRFIQSGSTAKNAKVLIIDIRANGGGGGGSIKHWFQNFTGQQLSEKRVEADRYSILNGETNGQSIYSDEVSSIGKFVPNDIPVILLVDDECGSSGESMLTAVKTMSNVLVVGSNSAGYQLGGNAVEIYLPNSKIKANIGIFIRFINQIQNVDGIGYEPDVWCNPKDALDCAIEMIRNYELVSAEELETFETAFENNKPVVPVSITLCWDNDGGSILESHGGFGTRSDETQYLTVLANGEPCTDFEVINGNDNVCTIEVVDGKIKLTPKSMGHSIIQVTIGKSTASFRWNRV